MASVPGPKREPTEKKGNKDWPTPVMTIEAATPRRPWVEIVFEEDGEPEVVEIKLLKEFSIADQSELQADGEEFDELYAKRGKSQAEKKRLKQILDRMFERVVVMDDGLRARCDDHVRGQVVTAFTLAPFERAARIAKEQGEETTDLSTMDI